MVHYEGPFSLADAMGEVRDSDKIYMQYPLAKSIICGKFLTINNVFCQFVRFAFMVLY